MSNSVVVQTVETVAHRIFINGDGIVRIYSKPSHIELHHVTELLDALSNFQVDDVALIVLMDPTEENSMTNEARKYIIQHMKNYIQVLAVVGRKKYVRVMYKIFSSFLDIGTEIKMFEKEETAEAWLMEKI